MVATFRVQPGKRRAKKVGNQRNRPFFATGEEAIQFVTLNENCEPDSPMHPATDNDASNTAEEHDDDEC